MLWKSLSCPGSDGDGGVGEGGPGGVGEGGPGGVGEGGPGGVGVGGDGPPHPGVELMHAAQSALSLI